MLKTDSPIPLYEQIKDYILHRINTGEWAYNTRIPSERDLAQQFDVSRVTVGKAIKELVRAGYLSVQIGKGTYVCEMPVRQQIDTLTSFTEEMSSRGQDSHSRVLRAEVVPADGEVAQVLGVPMDARIVQLERVRFAGQRPMAIERAAVLASLCPDILKRYDFEQESLYAVLRDTYGVQLVTAVQTFEARAASQDEADLLEISPGLPVLAVHRITYDVTDRACEEVKSVYRGDRYKFRARLSRI